MMFATYNITFIYRIMFIQEKSYIELDDNVCNIFHGEYLSLAHTQDLPSKLATAPRAHA